MQALYKTELREGQSFRGLKVDANSNVELTVLSESKGLYDLGNKDKELVISGAKAGSEPGQVVIIADETPKKK